MSATAQPQHQPALKELCECQNCLSAMKKELDTFSDRLVEDDETLTRIRAVHNSLQGIHSIIRTFPDHRGAA